MTRPLTGKCAADAVCPDFRGNCGFLGFVYLADGWGVDRNGVTNCLKRVNVCFLAPEFFFLA